MNTNKDDKIIHHDFGKKPENRLLSLSLNVDILFQDDKAALLRQTVICGDKQEITHQLVEIPPKE